MYMWVHVGTKTILIAWKKKPYGKKKTFAWKFLQQQLTVDGSECL